MSGGDILALEGVTKRFGPPRPLADVLRGRAPPGHAALSGVSLTLRQGEALGLIGESGSGKSTLARCLVALHGCDEGRVTWRGADLATLGRRERLLFHRRVQLVFQNPYSAMNPRMTVREALGEVLRVHRICPREAVEDEMAALLDRVRLPRTALDRRPHRFSGGQLQRVALARALALRPDAIIADEVVSALDVSVQAQIVNLLLELQAELGLAILFIAHDLALVRHLSHRIAVMYRGTVVEIGDRDAVFAAPAHPYTRLLIRSTPTLVPGAPAAGSSASGMSTAGTSAASTSARARNDSGAHDAGCVFRARCDRAEARCAIDAPTLRPFGPGRTVACHVAAEPCREAA